MEDKLEKLIKISVFIQFYYKNLYLIKIGIKEKSKYNIYYENLKEMIYLENNLLDLIEEDELFDLCNVMFNNKNYISIKNPVLYALFSKIKERYDLINIENENIDYNKENMNFHFINALKNLNNKIMPTSGDYDIYDYELKKSYYIMLMANMRLNSYIENLVLKYDFNLNNINLIREDYDYSQNSYENCLNLIYLHTKDSNIDNAENIIKRMFGSSLFESYLSDLNDIDYNNLYEFLTDYMTTHNNKTLTLFLNKMEGYTR
ncbi:MAG: hypothetical protein ACI4XR_03480 [Bacilli bacterium]